MARRLQINNQIHRHSNQTHCIKQLTARHQKSKPNCVHRLDRQGRNFLERHNWNDFYWRVLELDNRQNRYRVLQLHGASRLQLELEEQNRERHEAFPGRLCGEIWRQSTVHQPVSCSRVYERRGCDGYWCWEFIWLVHILPRLVWQ